VFLPPFVFAGVFLLVSSTVFVVSATSVLRSTSSSESSMNCVSVSTCFAEGLTSIFTSLRPIPYERLPSCADLLEKSLASLKTGRY